MYLCRCIYFCRFRGDPLVNSDELNKHYRKCVDEVLSNAAKMKEVDERQKSRKITQYKWEMRIMAVVFLVLIVLLVIGIVF